MIIFLLFVIATLLLTIIILLIGVVKYTEYVYQEQRKANGHLLDLKKGIRDE